jgi:hypothetical protein
VDVVKRAGTKHRSGERTEHPIWSPARDHHGPQRQPACLDYYDGDLCDRVAASVLLIASHDRPFMGEISVGPDPLLQVMPEAK